MEASSQQTYIEHNSQQKKYFSRSTRPTLLPKNSPYHQRHVDELIRFADLAPGERVLEVGCGMGRFYYERKW